MGCHQVSTLLVPVMIHAFGKNDIVPTGDVDQFGTEVRHSFENRNLTSEATTRHLLEKLGLTINHSKTAILPDKFLCTHFSNRFRQIAGFHRPNQL